MNAAESCAEGYNETQRFDNLGAGFLFTQSSLKPMMLWPLGCCPFLLTTNIPLVDQVAHAGLLKLPPMPHLMFNLLQRNHVVGVAHADSSSYCCCPI